MHFDAFGCKESRCFRQPIDAISAMQHQKLARIEPLLRSDMAHTRRGKKYDFLTEELRRTTGIVDTRNVSANGYDNFGELLIEQHENGFVLDCGSGKRPTYYSNVINYEIVDYDTTDVIGVGEALPFRDSTMDAVISVAVLEHVRDPFACAAEIVRVLKPGGRLLCCVPFLQPQHGYPHHYFNMAPQGLRSLFDRSLEIDDHRVIDSMTPIWSLTWFVRSWMAGLGGSARRQFEQLTMAELLAAPMEQLLSKPWVTELPEAQRFELASCTLLFAHKPA